VFAAPRRADEAKFALQTAYPAHGYSQIHIFTFDQSVSRLSANLGGGIGDLGASLYAGNQAASRLSARRKAAGPSR
jgi:hypothetical protein